MTSKRLYYVLLTSLGVLAVATVGILYFGTSLLAQKTTELNDLKTLSLALDEQQSSLIQAKQDVVTYRELETIAKTVVPQEKDQARTVREIVNLAEQSGIGISTITFPSSDLGDAKAGDNTQLEPVKGTAGLYQMDIAVQTDSSNPTPYEDFLSFLESLEQNRRTSQVINLSVLPLSNDRGKLTFNLVLRMYIKP